MRPWPLLSTPLLPHPTNNSLLSYSAHIEPLWHAWISYSVDTPPHLDPIKATGDRPWAPREHVPNRTFSRAAYKPYNTCVELPSATSTVCVCVCVMSADTPNRTKDKIQAWQPFAAPR
jgi:NADH dehydrogenase [ubiquinone] 1 alpha subcomplex assembly factor 2